MSFKYFECNKVDLMRIEMHLFDFVSLRDQNFSYVLLLKLKGIVPKLLYLVRSQFRLSSSNLYQNHLIVVLGFSCLLR